MQLFSFLKKEFVKNVLTLATGSMISQIVLYVSIVILTRLFSPELFGVYMLFSSSILILKPIATLRYEIAIVLPKESKDAINLVAFSIFVNITFCLVLFIIIVLFKQQITSYFKLTKLTYLVYYIPISLFLISTVSVIDYWNNRSKMFHNISKGLITKSITMSASQITIGFSKLNSIGLVPGLLVGQLFQLLIILKISLKTLKTFIKYISFKRMLYLAKKYKDIPTFNTVINIINNLSNELPILLITRYFGLYNSGIYGLAIKFIKSPVAIIQQSVSQVFYNRTTELHNNRGQLNKFIIKVIKKLLLIGVLILIPLFILSFYLDFIFGSKWVDVGLYARILIPWLFIAFISGPLTPLIVVLNKQKKILYYDFLLLLFRFSALYLGFKIYNNVFISLAFYSAIGFLFNLFIIFYLLKISKENNHTYI